MIIFSTVAREPNKLASGLSSLSYHKVHSHTTKDCVLFTSERNGLRDLLWGGNFPYSSALLIYGSLLIVFSPRVKNVLISCITSIFVTIYKFKITNNCRPPKLKQFIVLPAILSKVHAHRGNNPNVCFGSSARACVHLCHCTGPGCTFLLIY